jgi:hypothetical protein
MKRSDKNEEDNLQYYIDTRRIEKAPEEFTAKVMTRIRFETKPFNATERTHAKSLVPFIAALTTIVLIIISLIVPANNAESVRGFKFLQYFKLPSMNFHFDLLPTLNIPGWIPWLFIGFLMLIIFDLALSGLFHRQNQ